MSIDSVLSKDICFVAVSLRWLIVCVLPSLFIVDVTRD